MVINLKGGCEHPKPEPEILAKTPGASGSLQILTVGLPAILDKIPILFDQIMD